MDNNYEFSTIYNNAHVAGLKAVKTVTPTPMVVGSPTNLFGNDIDYSKKTYFVEGGVCGFAWIIIKPGTSKFAKWMKENGYAHTNSYEGGISMWVSDFGQSYERKMAYARAFADSLTDAGIKAYSNGRLD